LTPKPDQSGTENFDKTTPEALSPVTDPIVPDAVMRPLRTGFTVVVLTCIVFVIWAMTAPLTTSIHANGHLYAPEPSFDIQHPFGGDIAAVHVREHENVVAGQILMQMDVTSEQAQKDELEESLRLLQEERDALEWALDHDRAQLLKPDWQGSTSPSIGPVQANHMTAAPKIPENQQAWRIRNMLETLNVRRAATAMTADAMRARAEGLENSLAARLDRKASMEARFDRYSRLVKSGALRATDNDTLLESMLDLDASILGERAEAAALRSQAEQVSLQVKADALDLRQRLLDRQSQVAEAIPRLRAQILRLDAVIRNAELRAPSDGTIARLFYDTNEMFVPRGETVLTLTSPTRQHEVAFVVPPHAIDQTRVGLQGTLTVSSLPQRNHPKVDVKIRSLSPEARRNREGVIVGYDGIAEIDPNDLANLDKQLGSDFALFIDMPVTLIFAGRETTFSDYLVGPFLDFLAKAMQD